MSAVDEVAALLSRMAEADRLALVRALVPDAAMAMRAFGPFNAPVGEDGVEPGEPVGIPGEEAMVVDDVRPEAGITEAVCRVLCSGRTASTGQGMSTCSRYERDTWARRAPGPRPHVSIRLHHASLQGRAHMPRT